MGIVAEGGFSVRGGSVHHEHNHAVPEWIEHNLVEETIRIWQPLYGHSLTQSDALDLLINVGQILDLTFGG